MPKHYELLHVEGRKWEVVDGGIWCLDIQIGGDLLCVWSYTYKPDYLCIRYRANNFLTDERGIWLGPLETLCLIEEALKEASSIAKFTSSVT
jgi:hypothetical protein